MPNYVYDLEIFPNFFLAAFKEISEKRDKPISMFTWIQRDALTEFLNRDELNLVGYNSFHFDDPLLNGVLSGQLATTEEVFNAAEALINGDSEDSLPKLLKSRTGNWTCIDLMQILGGRTAGKLKVHEVRLGLDNVQDLPIAPGTILTEGQKAEIIAYCANDVNATEALYYDSLQRIEVRYRVNESYPYLKGSALRRSDAAIAEEVMAGELVTKAAFDRRQYRPKSSFTFNPADRIEPGITFSDPVNQATLERLRAFEDFAPDQWAKRHSLGFQFQVGEHQITLTQGGLHTDIGPTLIRSAQILEFDVSSYYPSLLLKFGRVPDGLPRKWIEILQSLTQDRLKAKAGGNKTVADVYKIVINSLYGKLADTYSINLDLSLQLQVVLNGQLFLLMLMERFQDQGFPVIAANTDGLYIDAGVRSQEAVTVAQTWEQETGFRLERKVATIYAATSVNSYALFHPDHEWFHKKGEFGLGMRTKPAIISHAVLKHISTGASVEDCIRQAADLLEFLYSGSAKGDVRVTQAGRELQRTNRWYKSLIGAPILRSSISAKGGERTAKVSNSDNAMVVNLLMSRQVPEDLDFSHYVAAAEATVAELNTATAKVAAVSKRVTAAQRAQKYGLVVVPKGLRTAAKANIPDTYTPETIDRWRRTPAAEADWASMRGMAATPARISTPWRWISMIPKRRRLQAFLILWAITRWSRGMAPERLRAFYAAANGARLSSSIPVTKLIPPALAF